MASVQQQPPHKFQLLKLPYLVIETVFLCMDHLELVDVSLCSKKCKNLVKSTRKSPMTYMDIEFGGNQHLFYLRAVDDRDIVSVWDFSKRVVRNKKTVQWWKLNGLEGYTKKQRAHERHYQCTAKQPLEISMATVISYLFELFPDCYVNLLTLQFLYNDLRCLPVLAAVKTVEHLRIHCFDRRDHIKIVLPNVNITKSFRTHNTVCDGRLVLEKLACTYFIRCHSASWLSPETFMTLNCKHVHLEKTILATEDILEYLKKWKNSTGDEMNRVQSMTIVSDDIEIGGFNSEVLGATAWNPEKRARYFKVEDKYVDCQRGMDIERADGLLASIVLRSGFTIGFFVWMNRFPVQPNFG